MNTSSNSESPAGAGSNVKLRFGGLLLLPSPLHHLPHPLAQIPRHLFFLSQQQVEFVDRIRLAVRRGHVVVVPCPRPDKPIRSRISSRAPTELAERPLALADVDASPRDKLVPIRVVTAMSSTPKLSTVQCGDGVLALFALDHEVQVWSTAPAGARVEVRGCHCRRLRRCLRIARPSPPMRSSSRLRFQRVCRLEPARGRHAPLGAVFSTSLRRSVHNRAHALVPRPRPRHRSRRPPWLRDVHACTTCDRRDEMAKTRFTSDAGHPLVVKCENLSVNGS